MLSETLDFLYLNGRLTNEQRQALTASCIVVNKRQRRCLQK